jgi:hypothetical protein
VRLTTKEVRVDANKLRADRREAAIEWVRSLGVNPEDVRPQFAIVHGEQGYELHLSRMLRNEAGKPRLDRAIGDVVSEPLILEIGQDANWPNFEGGFVE